LRRKAYAAKICQTLTDEQVRSVPSDLDIKDGHYEHHTEGKRLSVRWKSKLHVPIDEPQDARGLPESWAAKMERHHSPYYDGPGIYDYRSIPDVVITNGHADWPLKIWRPVLHA
ncbi:MAG: hypothetical protein IIZ88_03405, partial [Prevotella sp.]|nr:hypothetical protein [Prevotella sp.]